MTDNVVLVGCVVVLAGAVAWQVHKGKSVTEALRAVLGGVSTFSASATPDQAAQLEKHIGAQAESTDPVIIAQTRAADGLK